MIKAIDHRTGNAVNLDTAYFEAECPLCGKKHRIDLPDLLTSMEPEKFTLFGDLECYCARCTAKRAKG